MMEIEIQSERLNFNLRNPRFQDSQEVRVVLESRMEIEIQSKRLNFNLRNPRVPRFPGGLRTIA